MQVKFTMPGKIIITPENDDEKVLLYNFAKYKSLKTETDRNYQRYSMDDKTSEAHKVERLIINGDNE